MLANRLFHFLVVGVTTTVVVDVVEEFVVVAGTTAVEVGHGTTGDVVTEEAEVVGTAVGATPASVGTAVAEATAALTTPPAPPVDESVDFEEQPTKPKRLVTITTDSVFIFTPGSYF